MFTRTPNDQLFYDWDEPQPARPSFAELLEADARVLLFQRKDGEALVSLSAPNGEPPYTPLEQALVYHSHGFEFGYAGSGPADLALNVLALVLPPKEAQRLHQPFKFAHIATVDHEKGGSLALAEVRDWIAAYYSEELAAEVAPIAVPLTPEQERSLEEAAAEDRAGDDVDDGGYIAADIEKRDDVPPSPFE